jgi:predicted PurR-regulated permease PerM
MTADRSIQVMLGLCTIVACFAALYFARTIFVPVAFAFFIIALVWPLQSALQAKIPTLLALAITISVTAIVISIVAFLVVWGFGVVGQWLFRNAARLQELYAQVVSWLESHGVYAAALIAEYFDVSWMLRTFQQLTGRAHGLVTFAITTLVFLLLGLLEVPVAKRKLEGFSNREVGQALLASFISIGAKFRRYMLVRTAMSIITGIAIWAFSLIAGLELATAWGVIAFALNYIPFIGPFVATIFPSLFAIAQSESWQMALLVFMCLNLIQFLIGSYLEPRVAGAALSISPFMVLFAVFFWLFLWGIPGAFIGVPIMIAVVAICAQFDGSRWMAELLSGEPKESRPSA